MIILLKLAGAFTLALGLIHLFLPGFLGYRYLIDTTDPDPRPRPFVFVGHTTTRRDLMGIVWIMNHAASFTLITIGAVGLFATTWLAGTWFAAAWVALWWFLRAGTQFYMGRRPGDLLITVWFAALGVLHAVAVYGAI